MMEFVDPLVFWGMCALQLVALVSIVFARLQPSGWSQAFCRSCFFGSLCLVAMITMVAIGYRNGCWVWCGTTFSLMAVGATLDLGGSLRPTGF